VIHFIKEELFSDKAAVENIYKYFGLEEHKLKIRFKEWINSIFCQYTKLAMFRKVWLQQFKKHKERNYAEVLTEFTKLFLYQECYHYLIKNTGRKFRNVLVVNEYMKCIPLFVQGVHFPEEFTAFISRI
jgi:hypothetical protein